MVYTRAMPPKAQADVRLIPAIDLEQPQVTGFLSAIDRERVPSLLFAGPEGVGKELTAIEFGRELCCQRSPKCKADGELCESCYRAVRLEHPEIHLVYPTPTQGSGEGDDGDVTDIAKVLGEKRSDIFAQYRFSKKASIRIARARALIQRANMKPFDSPLHVFIIINAHAMREEAQNALLKIVEEPLPHSVFVFVTTNPEGILHTIRSRCQQVRFVPLKTSVVERILTSYYGIGEEDARRASALAQGNINRALELVESGDDQDRKAAAAFVAGITIEPDSWAIGQAMSVGRGNNREGVARFLDEVAVVFRDVMTGDESLYVNAGMADGIGKLAKAWDRRLIPDVIDRIARARYQILVANNNIDSTLTELFLHIKRSR